MRVAICVGGYEYFDVCHVKKKFSLNSVMYIQFYKEVLIDQAM